MKNIHNIYLIIVMLMAASLSAHAQVTEQWDGYEITAPTEGSGTESDPYIITSGAMLKWVQSDPSRWSKCYKQMADIDLCGNVLGMIGYGDSSGNTKLHKPFSGTYDGNGFAIKNLVIDLDDYSTTQMSFGLFGYISGGNVRNILLDNASLRSTVSHKGEYDVRIGALTGVVSPQAGKETNVENIIVKNTVLSDNGINLCLKSLMIGGVVGDLTNTFAGYDPITTAVGALNLKNLYADVDFDLESTLHFGHTTNQFPQFNVGGILGRARKPNYDVLPDYTFYTGQAKVLVGTFSPVWGQLRTNTTVDFSSMTNAYAGEVVTDKAKGTGITVLSGNEITIYGTKRIINEHRLYSDYKVLDNETTLFVDFTDLSPAYDDTKWQYGMRTLGVHKGVTGELTSVNCNEYATWRKWQGVNHAKYVQSDKATDSIVNNMFNVYAFAKSALLQWTHSDTEGVFFADRPGLELERTHFNTFEARVSRIAPGKTYEIIWTADHDGSPTPEVVAGAPTTIDADGKCTLTLTNHPDHYHAVRANVLPAGVSDVSQRLTYRTFLLDDPEIRIVRISETAFRASALTDWEDGAYRFRWYAIAEDGTETLIHTSPTARREEEYTFASFADLPNKIRVELLDDAGEPIYSFDDHLVIVQATTPITDIDPTNLPDYKIVAERRKVGRNDMIVVKLYDADGNQVAGGYDTDYIYEPDVTYKWEVNADPSDVRGWMPVNIGLPRNSWFPAYTSEMYYRITWQYGDNHDDVASTVLGRNLIFLYNKDITDAGRAKGKTEFDGKDHWTDAGGTEQETDFPDGDDLNDGSDPYNAVKTMKRAYELCGGDALSYDDNMIVVMGYYQNPDERMLSCQDSESWRKAVTITGKYGSNISSGAMVLYGDGASPATLYASTCIENIRLYAYDRSIVDANQSAFSSQEYVNIQNAKEVDKDARKTNYLNLLFIVCDFHDFKIGDNVSMRDYRNTDANMGLIAGTTAPYVNIVGANLNAISPVIPEVNDNAVPGVTTIIINSGRYARIISGGRNDAYGHNPCRLLGSPERPHYVDVKINITSDAYNPLHYPYDIALLVGGQTDGSVYSDTKIEVNDGKIGRFISGSISYGRQPINGRPADTFFGSVEITLKGGVINELYGGSLGRFGITDAKYANEPVKPYFYGRSIINIDGCTVKSNLYGAGSGGISGVGDDVYHTSDLYIPYYGDDNTVSYGDYAAAKGKVVKMTLRDNSTLDLNNTYCEININSGTINGNVFGAGSGYSDGIIVAHAIPGLGNLYGDCYINISQNTIRETLINGSVYGGGAGDKTYYINATDANKSKFTDLACLYGDTHIRIEGGKINGDVFGGAKGVKDFPLMANVFGNTNVDILDNAMIDGNIFGGCDYSSVRKRKDTDDNPVADTGNTNVLINGTSIIGDNIFGGNRGDKDMTYHTEVEGDTKVVIRDGTYIDTPYKDEAHTVYRTFNTYGGGYNNCIVRGDTYLDITRSLLKDTKSIGADFMAYWNDLTHRRFCVYGGGYGEDTDVYGSTHVDINVEAQDVLVRPDDGINFYLGKQFFDVAGGGYTGSVTNANITISGNSYIRKVIGGGFFGSVRKNTNTKLLSGIIFSAFGGCMMGYVHEQAHMQIGTHTDDGSSAPQNATLWITENVYGGNDVQGIVGAVNNDSSVSNDILDPANANFDPAYKPYADDVLYAADVDPAGNRGVFLNIYGGRIMGSVYGAGNGYYRGYYVPGFGRYADGPARFYRGVPGRTTTDNTEHKIYKMRPQVGRVNLNIQGNNENDKVQIDSMVFGSGRCCTIGRWDPTKQVEDPRRLRTETAGQLNVNFGSHVNVGNAIYLGARGRFFGHQTSVPKGVDLNAIMNYPETEVPNELLDQLGACGYDHWYYDYNAKTYKLGFPLPGDMHRNPFGAFFGQNPLDPENAYFLTGEHQFYGFLKFIEMASAINLTFYDNPYDASGNLRPVPANPDARVVGPDAFDVTDVTTGSFFLGGERGFMTYQPDVDPSTTDDVYAYDILLPEGLTVKDKVVGGCEKSWIKYYPYNDDMTEVITTAEPLYELKGGLGVQSDFGDGKNPEVKVINGKVYAHIKPGTPSANYAIRLSVLSTFDPQLGDDAVDPVTHVTNPYRRYGGLVYGGCYESGITMGDVVLNIGANMMGNKDIYHPEDPAVFGDISGLDYNVGRVYGAGFGQETEVHGNTYVYLLNNFTGFNVFGGGMQGAVTGHTNVSYIGNANSYVYGAIYGGSLMADVGEYDEVDGQKVPSGDTYGSTVALYSGNVDQVYGGSCLGNVYGGSYVYVCNNREDISGVDRQLSHINWADINNSVWGDARLVVGSVFGGNDMAGDIITDPAKQPLSTRIWMNEKTEPIFGSARPDSPGKHEVADGVYYSGFPLVGNIYGGSNADYDRYVNIANGDNTRTMQIDLTTYPRPDIERTQIEVNGGTVINLFGGGNKSTVTGSVKINVNYTDTVARAGFNSRKEADLMWNVMHLTQSEQFNEVLRATGDDKYVFERQIYRAFGGNNVADMAIQPRWDLKSGHLGSVYSGGNIGRMTYYNPVPDTAPIDANDKDFDYRRSKGLSLTVDSKDIRIKAVYGGGRIGDIEALSGGVPVQFTDDEDYGATLNVRNGIVETVFGGNDVAGYVRNGTRVNISGAISGDVYGAGNGDYRYRYDQTGTYDAITEEYTPEGRRFFVLPAKAEYAPYGGNTKLDDAQVVLAINSYRPNVDRAYLNIQGSETSHVWVKGNVYCGGNSSTISARQIDPADPASKEMGDIRFNIGSYVTLNGVFMGSNGQDLVYGPNIQDLERLNGIDMSSPNALTAAVLPDGDKSVAGNPLYP